MYRVESVSVSGIDNEQGGKNPPLLIKIQIKLILSLRISEIFTTVRVSLSFPFFTFRGYLDGESLLVTIVKRHGGSENYFQK